MVIWVFFFFPVGVGGVGPRATDHAKDCELRRMPSLSCKDFFSISTSIYYCHPVIVSLQAPVLQHGAGHTTPASSTTCGAALASLFTSCCSPGPWTRPLIQLHSQIFRPHF